jgi:hypothetical protein
LSDEKREDVPDIYCNGVQMGISPYDLTIELQLNSPPKEGNKQSPVIVGKVRMSLEHAKIFAIMLAKNLKGYESQTGGPIRVHPELLKNLGISKEEDWWV